MSMKETDTNHLTNSDYSEPDYSKFKVLWEAVYKNYLWEAVYKNYLKNDPRYGNYKAKDFSQ